MGSNGNGTFLDLHVISGVLFFVFFCSDSSELFTV